jgi:hypothetical protein
MAADNPFNRRVLHYAGVTLTPAPSALDLMEPPDDHDDVRQLSHAIEVCEAKTVLTKIRSTSLPAVQIWSNRTAYSVDEAIGANNSTPHHRIVNFLIDL